MRNELLYLADIQDAIAQIQVYTKGLSFDQFTANRLIIDGVVRNLEIVGEAVKHLPTSVRDRYPNIPWREIAGMRDIIAHEYFGINIEVVWDVVTNELHPLLEAIGKELP